VNSKKCTLCEGRIDLFYSKSKIFYICRNCKGISLDEKFFLKPDLEIQHYQRHNNNVNDADYKKFVSPITDSILDSFSSTSNGLDFGAGTGPVISKILQDNNFKIQQYDPFFHPNYELLNKKYDFIACCEVIEHFHNPKKEFQLLYNMLNDNGKLLIMTDLYTSEIIFDKWYYKNDPTHVFFYQNETFQKISNLFNFTSFSIENRLIILNK
jgi:SAM-dependent methyltransferase